MSYFACQFGSSVSYLFERWTVRVCRRPDPANRRRYLEAAAVAVALPSSSSQPEVLRLLCWLPAQMLTPEALRVGTFVWLWGFAAAPVLQVAAGHH
jgi:PI4-kinase N-terminal region